VKVHPQPEQESIFRTVFAWWLRFGGIFRRSLRGRRLKKGRQLFWDKILATPMSTTATITTNTSIASVLTGDDVESWRCPGVLVSWYVGSNVCVQLCSVVDVECDDSLVVDM